MSVLDKKKEVFGKIAAARTLTEGIPKLKQSSSFESLNNKVSVGNDKANAAYNKGQGMYNKVKQAQGNVVPFLTDLIKSLIGFAALINETVNILTHSLPEIEKTIKNSLKFELKSIVSCGIDPSLPAFLKSTGSGVVIEVNKVDFFDILLIDPNSVGGKTIYNDITSPLTSSSDFNTFLYGVVQDDGVMHTWRNILDITFNSLGSGTRPNNAFTIKANPSYDSKTLTDLNNNYIDTLTLFNSENIVSKIIDMIFGSVAASIGKTKKQLETEAKVNNVIDNIVNSDSDSEISDSSFTFTNEEVYQHQEQADFRQKGILKLECCNKVPSSIPVDMLTTFNDEMSGATSTAEKKTVVSNNLNRMANQSAANSTDNSDDIAIKLNFIQNIINNLVKTIVSMVLSPKVVMIFMLDFKIINGLTATFDDPVDFIKKNKALFKAISKKISEIIIKLLMKIVLKKIAELVAAGIVKKQTEKAKARLTQLLSLVGIPQDALRAIKGLV